MTLLVGMYDPQEVANIKAALRFPFASCPSLATRIEGSIAAEIIAFPVLDSLRRGSSMEARHNTMPRLNRIRGTVN
jgi:hypothetical protein